MPNIVERPIVPYNPSPSKVLQKEQYSLFAPIAANGRVGMAGYNPEHFNIRDQIVSLNTTVRDLRLSYYYDDISQKNMLKISYVDGEGNEVAINTIPIVGYNPEHFNIRDQIVSLNTTIKDLHLSSYYDRSRKKDVLKISYVDGEGNETAIDEMVSPFVPIDPPYGSGGDGTFVYTIYPDNSVRLVELDMSLDPWGDPYTNELDPERLDVYGGTIVQRATEGAVYVPKKPFSEYDATSKWYVDELGKRVEKVENNNIVYDNKNGIMSTVPIPLIASPNAVVVSIGGLNKKIKNMLPDGSGYYPYSAQWESVVGVDLEEGVTYILDTDDTDLTIDVWSPPESGFGSEYVAFPAYTAPASGTYNFWIMTHNASSDVGRFRIVKYTGNIPVSKLTTADIKEYLNLKDTKVYELPTVDAGENVLFKYYVPSVAFSDTKFSLGDGIGAGVDSHNYLDLTKDQLVGNYVRIVFTGEENWLDKTLSSTSTTRYCINLQNYALPYVSYKANGSVNYNVPAPAICDSYDVGSITALGKSGYGFAISSTDIYFYDKNFPTVDAWKNYLQRRYESGNPLTVVYKVATPHVERANLPDIAYLIYVKDGAYIKVLDKDGNLVEAPVSITFTKLRGD